MHAATNAICMMTNPGRDRVPKVAGEQYWPHERHDKAHLAR